MIAVFPSNALKTNLRQVKEATEEQLAIITDTGNTQYVFGSEGSFEDDERETAAEAAYARRIITAVERGRAGIQRGEYVVGADAFIAYAEQKRLAQ